jgi:His-Xaa-Ser repeat protein HxsA
MQKSLTAAGALLSVVQGAHAEDTSATTARYTDLAVHDASFAVSLSAPLNVNVRNMYAGHSSHSSHASHASHSSGSGGSYTSPAYTPSYTPTYTAPTPAPAIAAPEITPAYRATTTATTTRATADELRSMIMRVQAALYTRGYDPGAIDGILSEPTKNALGGFQAAHGLPRTRSMTTATLNALGVSLGR